ncbi:pyridoxamine 5'-phosphate oxidase [Actinocatenispora thailandica]|uniref:Pyridoxamine 5'-phosphate oxidase n=1 Tax=Actinocatenispora thailandica TaxID=227318 RepID=A0A7R7DRG6_9ACTN|nr:pyridoxamine 5'-phosphate oxidase family protein [Actinocatenispora thailandica]BCJ36331.1 pyridoxamine 5'-phosphate oxidase [Actinocatenispora thailandica]
MALDQAQRAELLATPLVATLAVEDGTHRGPLVAPIWYAYRPGGDFVMFTGAGSRKAAAIRLAGRCSLLVQRDRPTYRYVGVEGTAGLSSADASVVREIAGRYLTGAALDDYVAEIVADPGASVAITLTPRHWVSADIGLGTAD